MAGPTLPAHPDPPRPLTPIPFRRFMDPIDEITRLVQTIHELAVDRGVTEEVMTIWETGMLRICNGHDNQRALSTFASSVISCFLAEVRLMEAQLVIDSHVVLGGVRRHLRDRYTVEGFRRQWIEVNGPSAFARAPAGPPSHSLARHSGVSGRYAAMMGLTTDGVDREGGYHFARF